MKVLIITTSHDKLGDTGHKTGVWLEELAAPYYAFVDAGWDLTLASPLGGVVPLDPKSEDDGSQTEATKRFIGDINAMQLLTHSAKLDTIKAADFDVVFVPGGHGPMWDIADNPVVNELISDFNKTHKPIGSVCHGVAALVGVKNTEGKSLVQNRNVTSFTNEEEDAVQLSAIVPFLLESRLKDNGALFSKASMFQSHVVVDGNLVTGQNPASSVEAADATMKLATK